MEEYIAHIKGIQENETVRLSENLIVWKEGSSYDVEVTNRQFDALEKLINEQKEKPYYLIDLSLAGRPSPEIIYLIEKRLKPIKDQIRHAAIYTGNNHLMLIGIKFYFIKFDFPSYSGHGSLKNALKSFV